ncbi:RNA deprotection pyrophosphohydrolase [Thalassobacillus sp. CUG 92003]|uniref:RNA deprotection pyrophosphohydrolase n=1 Tax=Thalassobacillus sp. CUG 92003 TaxID=2736641 RepID=UPI0015E6C2D4|nr:nucleoside triphosphatase YtkD [Thalassobacillus sp. CUG 92003]
MKTFYDYYHNQVKLSFDSHPFSEYPKHVWVICRFGKQWLLTKHKDRGLEFPGGKVEDGETPDEAAVREVMEETGGEVSELTYIGQYFVEGRGGTIIKNIYFARASTLYARQHYFETNGPMLLDALPSNIKKDRRYSFMMKDGVLPFSLRQIDVMNLNGTSQS